MLRYFEWLVGGVPLPNPRRALDQGQHPNIPALGYYQTAQAIGKADGSLKIYCSIQYYGVKKPVTTWPSELDATTRNGNRLCILENLSPRRRLQPGEITTNVFVGQSSQKDLILQAVHDAMGIVPENVQIFAEIWIRIHPIQMLFQEKGFHINGNNPTFSFTPKIASWNQGIPTKP